jgi:hypothetical protein
MIVGLVRETAAFERLGEEGDPRLLEEEIAELLGDGKPRTRDEISTKSKGGIGARKEAVEACLTGNAHLFRSVPGNEVGRSARATVWLLARGSGRVGASTSRGGSGNPPRPTLSPSGREAGRVDRRIRPPRPGRLTSRSCRTRLRIRTPSRRPPRRERRARRTRPRPPVTRNVSASSIGSTPGEGRTRRDPRERPAKGALVALSPKS